MNWMIFPTLLVAVFLFIAGVRLSRLKTNRTTVVLILLLGVLLALPGIIFATYYLKFFGEATWFYYFRSLPGSELAAGGAGLLTGWLHGRFKQSERFQKIAGRAFFPGLLLMGLLVPYLKPIIRQPNWNSFSDRWSDNVCLQSSDSSCGPACVATLLKLFGKPANEKEVARESFTSAFGTENWYLARALRRRGLTVHYFAEPLGTMTLHIPAIAGVRLTESSTGHFITLLGKQGENYIVGDPLVGLGLLTEKELFNQYNFTGFFMAVNSTR